MSIKKKSISTLTKKPSKTASAIRNFGEKKNRETPIFWTQKSLLFCAQLLMRMKSTTAYKRDWLRPTISGARHYVEHKPYKRVTFLLDEFTTFCYLPEFATSLSAYAGFEVNHWSILQSILEPRAKAIIGRRSSATQRCHQFFNISATSPPTTPQKSWIQAFNDIKWGKITCNVINISTSARQLITPYELWRESGEYIFAFLGDKPPTFYAKEPYYAVIGLVERANQNPYNN